MANYFKNMKRYLLHTVLVLGFVSIFLGGCNSTSIKDNALENNLSDETVISDPLPETPDAQEPVSENPEEDNLTETPLTNPDPDPDPAPNPDPDPLPESVPCEAGTFCIITTDLPDANLSDPYLQRLFVQEGTGVGYTWSISRGTLPDGLVIDGNNEPLLWESAILTGNADSLADGLAAGDLTEISGIAASRLNPEVLWVLDDSGNGPDLFAIHENGEVLQKYTMPSVVNHDWEDMAIGKGPDPNKEYIYIGDFGDNASVRANYQIMRVDGPLVPIEQEATISLNADIFYYQYPDEAKNCEAMVIDWDDDIIYLIQKTDGKGLVYKFPSSMNAAWDALHPVVLLPVSGSGIVSGLITGADSSRDNERILIRQYNRVWEYARSFESNFESIFDEAPVEVALGDAKNQQYEAIAYSSDGKAFYTVTEKAGQVNIPIYKFEAELSSDSTTISGIPLSVDVNSFIVQVKDSAGNITSREFVLNVK